MSWQRWFTRSRRWRSQRRSRLRTLAWPKTFTFGDTLTSARQRTFKSSVNCIVCLLSSCTHASPSCWLAADLNKSSASAEVGDRVELEWFKLGYFWASLRTPFCGNFEFRRNLWRQKTTVHGLSYGVVCVILRLAVLVQCRLVTDGRTDEHTTTLA